MIQQGNEITIVACEDLGVMRLMGLAGRRAVVTEDLTMPERRQLGYMVRLLDGEYLNEESWYVPVMSVINA